MRRFFFGLSLLLFAGLNAQSLNVPVRAKRAFFFNPENGAIIFEKRAHESHHPASVIKIATALFVLDQKKRDLNKHFIASKEALKVMNANIRQKDILQYPPYVLEHDGMTMGLIEGEEHSFNTLFHCFFLNSNNDAANVIAENISGSIEQFMNELNVYFRQQGIVQSNFMNPHGLHHPAQITTAYEMGKIAAMAFANKEFCKISRTSSYLFPDSEREIRVHNRLLKDGKYHYPKIIGAKTGYIAKAGNNLVACAEEGGRRLIAVLFGYKIRNQFYEDAISLFEAAFREEKKTRLLFSKENDHFSQNIEKANHPLQTTFDSDVTFSYYPSEECELETEMMWDSLELPIAKGALVGNLVVKNVYGYQVLSAPLFAMHSVKKAFFYRFLEGVQSHKLLCIIIFGLMFSFQVILQRKKKSAKIGKG